MRLGQRKFRTFMGDFGASLLVVTALTFGAQSQSQSKPARYEPLPVGRIAEIKNGPCTFIHVWATWCSICVQELEQVLRKLHAMKQVHPVVIDISPVEVQEGFSKKYLETLPALFTTYLKPAGDERTYFNEIDAKWRGELPFSALYQGGKKRAQWIGALDLEKLPAEVDGLCRKE